MRQLLKTISPRQWRFVFGLALVTIVITSIPYIYGYLSTPEDMVYTGIHHLAPGDTNAYLSMIEQVKQGHGIFLNLFTAEAQARVYTNPLYLVIGWAAKVFYLPNLLALHLARIVAILFFIFIAYLLICYFFSSESKRRWTLLILLFSSGLGLFFNPFLFNIDNILHHPTDIWIAESVTFLTLYHYPHLIASLTLIVLIFLLQLLAFESGRRSYSLWAGLACFFLVWFHPFNIVTVYAVLAVYLLMLFLWQRKIVWSYVRNSLWLVFMPLPAFLYLYLMNRRDWVISMWNGQNVLPSPDVWMYVIGYGLLLILAVIGLWRVFRQPSSRWIFPVAWFFTSAMLVYVPLAFQRRLSEGLHFPVSVLAAVGIFYLFDHWRKKTTSLSYGQMALGAVLFIFLPLSNIQILGQDIYLYQKEKTAPYYLTVSEMRALAWLKDNTDLNDVIFSAFNTGNFIPAYSGRVVWLGQWPQTADLERKLEQSDWFWQDDGQSAEKLEFLKQNDITYVFWGRYEKTAGNYDPSTKKYLQQVFSENGISIYKVLP